MALIHPSKAALYIPPGLKKFKLDLFERIGRHIAQKGGKVVRDDERRLLDLSDDMVPIVGCTPVLRPLIDGWLERKRTFVYWDRGYARRVFATWLPRGDHGGYYRWHVNAFQMQELRDVSNDRWNALKTEALPWQKGGKHIVIAAPTFAYSQFHKTERWTDEIVDALARVTDRPLIIRGKESKRPLYEDLKGAHALVSHGSNAANEAAIFGYPVFVDKSCAAALVGKTDVTQIETPAYPDRQPWFNSLAYSQYGEHELVNGTLWKLLA